MKKETLTSVFALFSTGITIVTNGTNRSKYYGCTINSFTSLSLNPPKFLFCLGNDNPALKSFSNRSPLNINILSKSQLGLSKKFSGPIEDRWNNTKFDLAKNKVPFFLNSLGLIQAVVEKKILSGDHTIIICKITDYSKLKNSKSLIYYKSSYHFL